MNSFILTIAVMSGSFAIASFGLMLEEETKKDRIFSFVAAVLFTVLSVWGFHVFPWSVE